MAESMYDLCVCEDKERDACGCELHGGSKFSGLTGMDKGQWTETTPNCLLHWPFPKCQAHQ